MGEPLNSLLSYFFTERPLRWGTSSLRYLFSEQLLIWATCLPATSVASATQFFSARSQYSAFCNVQLQFCRWWRTFRAAVTMRLATSSCNPTCQAPGASKHCLCFAARSPANALCHSRLQSLIAGVSQQIDQRSRSADNGDDSALLRSSQLFKFFVSFSLQFGAHCADLIF